MDLNIGASDRKLAPCLVCCPEIYCKWINNIFNLSLDLTWSLHWGVMQIYGWKLLAVCHHPDKSCDYKHWYGENIVLLICHLSSREHMFKWLRECMDGSSSLLVTTLPCFLGSSANRDIEYFICQVISQNHVIKGSSNFLSVAPLGM